MLPKRLDKSVGPLVMSSMRSRTTPSSEAHATPCVLELLHFLAIFLICTGGSVAMGSPTQEEVFRSISSNVSETGDPGKFMALLAAVGGLVVLLIVISRRKQETNTFKSLNHGGKLMKEVALAMDLKPAELKKLKSLAVEADVSSPLVLMLCPSILKRTVHARSTEKSGT